MALNFPSTEWLQAAVEKLNTDEQYAKAAQNWEADMNFVIEPGGPLAEQVTYYMDLWHGQCRQAFLVTDHNQPTEAALTLAAPYENLVRVLKGELDPMQALLTRKLNVKGNIAYLLRNVPTVLNFVRCLREIETNYP